MPYRSIRSKSRRKHSRRSGRRSRKSSRVSRKRRSLSKRNYVSRHSLSLRRLLGGEGTAKKKVRPSFEVGQAVRWEYAGNTAYGVVFKIHYADVELEVHGKTIKMNGRPNRPVYEIKQESGTHLLKSANQLKKSSKKIDA